MARKQVVDLSSWPSLTLEGNIIAPAMVAKVDQRGASEQAEEDYGVRKGLSIREEISLAFRVGQSHFDDFRKSETPSTEATRRFVQGLLKEAFGFDDMAAAPAPVSQIAGGRAPVVIVPPEEELDKRSPTLSVERSLSPAFALQDYLNQHEDALWGLVTNGKSLRLMRDNASLTRPAYIEADLEQIFSNEDIASFAVLWLLIHRSRFGKAETPATDCALERWREAGSKEGEAARDRLADQVQLALKSLGSGFLEANPDLQNQLKSGDLPLTDWFNELLRLVYRLIFLMVAEDRNLLHAPNAKKDARKLYVEGYSLAHLRSQCVRRSSWDRHHDRYEGLKVVFGALTRGESKLALPALGGLFAQKKTSRLDTAKLRNKAFMEALYRLAWLSDKSGIVPVNWRAMETEELGSVYETLLELQPQLSDDGRELRFASESAEQKGNQRKTTGSYYTPDSLVQALLDTALDPVLDKTEAEADDPAKALLKLSVIDPACGSGHFLLAAARRIATRLARIRAEGTPSLVDFRHALRDVARCCIHGVDRNPMAVELTKVALWIETVDPGLPLGFFDAQIRCGDALLGVFDLKVLEDGIPDAAYKPLTGDDKDVAKFYERANKDAKKGQGTFDFTGGRSDLPTAPLSAEFSDLRDLPEDTVEDVEAKAKAYRSLRKQDAFLRARMGCNLYTSAFLLPKTGDVPSGDSERIVPTSQDVWLAVGQGKGRKPIMENAKAAMQARALHWPLEFPDIMGRGGFNVVLGNPPWEKIKLLEKEFFASRDAEIATAPNKAARDKLIASLRSAEIGSTKHALFKEFESAKRFSEANSTFVRVSGDEGGRFALTGKGDVNTYALFAELFASLMGEEGRAGVIVPTGVATDATTAPFFAHLVNNELLAGLISFENEEFIFPAVHHSFRFCLLSLSREPTNEPTFAFFLRNTGAIAEEERFFTLSPDEIAAINPNTRTAPVFRSRWDAELSAKIHKNTPVLIDEGNVVSGNPWAISFIRMLDMSNDSSLFRTATELDNAGFARDGADWVIEGARPAQGALDVDGADTRSFALEGGAPRKPQRYVPLYEAKMIHQFDHRWAGYVDGEVNFEECTELQKQDRGFEPIPRYWVPESEVNSRLSVRDWRRQWVLGWRDVTSAHVFRTAIATVFRAIGAGNSLPLMLFEDHITPEQIAALSGNLSSFVFDFATRFKVGGTHLNYFIIQQLPVLPPSFYSGSHLNFVMPRVLELTYTSHSLAPFARDLGHDGPPFAWDEDRRALLRAELDAFYARAYGLTRDELRYILDPAEVKGPDYPSETFRVLKEKEIRQHGEYRTRRLVLEAWDRMEANGEFTAMGM